jgi:UTP-glucose-1-phosphate uridylyltransferase
MIWWINMGLWMLQQFPKKAKAKSCRVLLKNLRWVLHHQIFQWWVVMFYLPNYAVLEQTPKGAGNEIQLTDAIAMLQSEQVEAYRMQGQTFDCGSKLAI